MNLFFKVLEPLAVGYSTTMFLGKMVDLGYINSLTGAFILTVLIFYYLCYKSSEKDSNE